MWKNLCVAALAAGVMGVVGASCGGVKNVCVDRDIRCQAPLICDPGDGVCKCGGRGGRVCDEASVCDPVANTCISKRCDNVDCTDKPGTSCDVVDGLCKCGGTGGTICAANEQCNPNAAACVARSNCNQVACPFNQTCDSVTGACKCGTTTCNAGQTCTIDGNNQKSCVADNCTGVACTGAAVCDGADGLCKCNGVVCQSGQACACPAGADGGMCASSARACRVSGLCNGVTCGNGTTCDPGDGQCKCGGPGGPVCASNQICNLGPPPQCEGGAQCVFADGGVKTCAGGTSCDPEDGVCKCGGRGGVVCAPASDGLDGGAVAAAEICVSNQVQKVCRKPCDVRSPDCESGKYCYFDSSAETPASYCATPSDSKDEDSACTTPTSCFSMVPGPRSLHCLGLALGQTGICRAYCDTAAGTAGCLQDRPRTCLPIPNAAAGTGYCNPQ
ncbi:MAG: hypothetical protein U0228_32520 [Myxococcaceae bacterium]